MNDVTEKNSFRSREACYKIFEMSDHIRALESHLYSNDYIFVRGEGHLTIISRLETIHKYLNYFDICPVIQDNIKLMINELNRKYIDSGLSKIYSGDIIIQNISVSKISGCISQHDRELVINAISSWKEKIASSLYENYGRAHKIETSFIDKDKLLSGITAFLNNDILNTLSDGTKNDLENGIECILNNTFTPAAMVIFRASEESVIKLYEKKIQKSPKSWHDMIKELLDKGNIKEPLHGYLNYIRDKRNEAEHPGKDFNQYECEQSFIQVISMIQEIYNEVK